MKRRQAAVTEVSPGGCQSCRAGPDKRVTQTCRSNLSNVTCLRGLPTKELEDATTRGLERRSFYPSPPSAIAARTEAERRWSSELLQFFEGKPISYGEAVGAIDAEMASAATDAEMQKRGMGLACLLRKLRIPA